tara:strand:+ start:5789 stop:6013 length:225 start_codon:yes stop_codon:yes gene_type:complete
MTTITRIWTGVYKAEKNGKQIGSIASDQPAGGIAQGGTRHYTACFQPNPKAEGFTFSGSLKACKQWINDMSSVL